jgi:hypothetical protein
MDETKQETAITEQQVELAEIKEGAVIVEKTEHGFRTMSKWWVSVVIIMTCVVSAIALMFVAAKTGIIAGIFK